MSGSVCFSGSKIEFFSRFNALQVQQSFVCLDSMLKKMNYMYGYFLDEICDLCSSGDDQNLFHVRYVCSRFELDL